MNSPPYSKQKVQIAAALGYYVRRDRSDQLDKKLEIESSANFEKSIFAFVVKTQCDLRKGAPGLVSFVVQLQ